MRALGDTARRTPCGQRCATWRRSPALLACATLLAALALAGCAVPGPAAKEERASYVGRPYTTVREEELPVEEPERPSATSSPRDLWRQGSMPFLYQIDPEWAEHPYCGGTLAVQGCGPTALDMVYIYLTGDTSMDPADMADFSTQNGFASDGSGTYWSLMTTGAAQLGLSGRQLSISADVLRAELEAGRPVICVMRPGHFTQIGHFIVVERLALDGGVVVHDSNSVGRSMRTWSLDLVCSEAKGAWSFSLA